MTSLYRLGPMGAMEPDEGTINKNMLNTRYLDIFVYWFIFSKKAFLSFLLFLLWRIFSHISVCFICSVPMWKRYVLRYQRLFSSPGVRGCVFLLIVLMATPLGLLVTASTAFFMILTSLCLPFLIGPLCVSLYITLLAYVTWRLLQVSMKLMKSFVYWLKKRLVKNALNITPDFVELFSSVFVIQTPKDEPKQNQAQASLDESLSSGDCEVVTQDDVKQLNVQSVSELNKKFFSIFFKVGTHLHNSFNCFPPLFVFYWHLAVNFISWACKSKTRKTNDLLPWCILSKGNGKFHLITSNRGKSFW